MTSRFSAFVVNFKISDECIIWYGDIRVGSISANFRFPVFDAFGGGAWAHFPNSSLLSSIILESFVIKEERSFMD